ncbi:hypothetical protein NFI96_020696, partial [Prochilodus magdalenae]
MTHIKATIDVTVDPHQYAYRRNRSTDDAISSVVHTALTHLEQKDSYVRMLFVDFTSAFNTMIPQTLTDKLSSLGLRSSLCNWVLDFLTNRPQSVRIHNLSSSTTILSTGSPQGCVLSPLLFTLLTYDCSPIHPGCHIVKFADDTAVVGCITNSDESGYRQEVEHLEGWCRKNNLCINIKKTKEMIVDFRRGRHAHLPLHVGGSAVEVVSSYRYLGVHLSNNLTWSNNTSSLVRKAHQRLYFLRRLRRAGLGSSVLTSFYRCVVESVLCSSINVWHGSCSAADRKALQRVVKAAQRSVGVSLPTTTDIYTSRCRKRATCIMKDPTHPAHSLFVPLPSGRRLRSIKCRTNRLRNSFIPEAVRLLNATYSGRAVNVLPSQFPLPPPVSHKRTKKAQAVTPIQHMTIPDLAQPAETRPKRWLLTSEGQGVTTLHYTLTAPLWRSSRAPSSIGVHQAEDLTWSLNTSTITKKAQQHLYFQRRPRKAHLPPPILTTFYRGTIESILSSCITAWFGNCTASDRKSLQPDYATASFPKPSDSLTTRV